MTVPKVYSIGETKNDAYFLISFLEEGRTGSYRDLAEMIARMHQTYNDDRKFGYASPYRGSKITFDNDWVDSWIELFVTKRMDVLQEKIIENKQWDAEQEKAYEKVRTLMIHELYSHESKPSLLHGDLWGGNHMFLMNGKPALFDPHPLYGDREFDIGITTSFGTYPQEFYQAYQSFYPMAEGYQKRLNFYRLYIFMMHLHKFGGTYESRVNQTIQSILSH